MQILPAIDIKDGQAVRLFKGDFNQKTVVNPDIIEQAKTFKNAGIQFIHLVDLDGTLDGRATNRDLITEVKKISGLGIEVGGGIDRIVVGIDAKAGLVATEGWLETSNVDYITLAKEMEKMGVTLFIYTDVDRDGTLTGPNLDHYKCLVSELTTAKVIASGGVAELADLNHLQEIGVAGTIVGKAYYNGNITLDQLKSFGG